MPVILLDRLPLPSLRAYTVISVALLSCSVYYAVQVTSDPNWKANSTLISENNAPEDSDGAGELKILLLPVEMNRNVVISLITYLRQLMAFIIQEPLCIWTLINMAYCCLILLGKSIQQLVFGELRVSEQQHIKDKFWNFVFYKFIFVFGVINVQYVDEVVLWCSWFSVLGFLHLLAQLCKDRFEYLSFSPTTPGWSHIRLLSLLAAILLVSFFMFLICVAVGIFGSLNTFAFMIAECVQLSVQTAHVMASYGLHLYDVRQGSGRTCDKRGPLAYYTELAFELLSLLIDLVHHLHMLLWSNIFLSMASLVICMQLRFLMHEIQRRIKKHRNYLWVLDHMEKNYPMATAEELSENCDNCAICWEKMDSARKLPCTHLFHNSCLQAWLAQDTSCPTCRLVLSIEGPASLDPGRLEPPESTGENAAPVRRAPNHFFHFDGSRYVSWLPSFSVEVTHTQLLRSDQHQPAQTSQLDAMARQVQQLFPHLALATVIEDLRSTRSVELTIENVLDGRVLAPPPMFHRESTPPPQLEPPPLDEPSTADAAPAGDWGAHAGQLCGGSEVQSMGGRFSKCSTERERMLSMRKEQLVSAARRRYVERHNADAS